MPSGSDSVIAVTGATGFIGTHLLSRLDAIDRPTRALIRNKPHREVKVPNTTQVVSGTLSDSKALSELIHGAKICIHAAGATKAFEQSGFHAVNVIGTFRLAAAAAAAGVEHFIYLSSQAARRPQVSDYAASKAVSEASLESFRSKMRVTIIRPPAVLGPGDPMLKPMFDLVRAGWLPAPSEPSGGPRQFAVVSAHDLVEELIETAIGAADSEDFVEPCSVAATNWRDVAIVASQILDKKVRLQPVSPAFMRSVAGGLDVLGRLVRRPMPISYGKVQELLAADWTYDEPVRNAMDLKEILRLCLRD